MSKPQLIYVAAGILVDASDRVLLTERLGDSPFVGLWEFPGGKIRAHESPAAAMMRELREELGIEVRDSRHFMDVRHDYADRRVDLNFFLVRAWDGEPHGLDGQALTWRHPAEIKSSELLPADVPVLNELCRMVRAADHATSA